MNTFFERLEKLRRGRSLTQVQLAHSTGISQASISRYCSGKSEPSMSDGAKLARFFGVTMEWLLTGTDNGSGKRCARCEAAELRADRAERELEALKSKLRRITGDG